MITRERAYQLRAIIEKLALQQTDEKALESVELFPKWKADVNYELDTRVNYNDILYRCITAHTSQATWQPDVAPSLWAKVLVQDGQILPWEQPDSTNPYQIGDKVTHKGKTWICTIANNVWEPPTYWSEVNE